MCLLLSFDSRQDFAEERFAVATRDVHIDRGWLADRGRLVLASVRGNLMDHQLRDWNYYLEGPVGDRVERGPLRTRPTAVNCTNNSEARS